VTPAECYERSGRWALLCSRNLYLVSLTLLALTNAWWALPILWLLTGLAIAGLFVLGHDASHGALGFVIPLAIFLQVIGWAVYVHHVDPDIRWWPPRLSFNRIPRAARAIAEAYPDTVREGRSSVSHFWTSTRTCKLYDVAAGTWLAYSAAH